MSDGISLSDVLALPLEERLLLVEEIWDSIVAAPAALELSDAQRDELDARFEAYRKDPGAGAAWNEVKSRVLGST